MSPARKDEKAAVGRPFSLPTAEDLLGDPRDDGPGLDYSLEEGSVREMGYAFVDLIAEYLQGLEGRRVYGPMSPAGMDDIFAEDLPEEGTPFSELVQDCRTRVFPNTMAIGSRRYFGMMNPGPLPVAIFAEALAAAMNQNVASWRHAPAGTAIEKRVVRWLCSLFGLPEGSFGTLTPGGSLANITGLKLAINRSLGRDLSRVDIQEPPGPEMDKLTFYVSSQGHYSFDKAIDLLGLGRSQLRKIPQDQIFRIDIEALEASIRQDLEMGLQPCCIIGIGGCTNTGSIDKLEKLAELSQRYGCWFHVDAAYGGAVILSEMYGPMLRGIELADSITVDPHKWFYMPFESGGILVRDGDFLRKSFLVHPEYYMEKVLQDDSEQGETTTNGQGRRVIPDPRGFHRGDKVNFFQYGIQGSRRQNALKLWLAFKMVGRRQYAAWVEKDIELARILAARMRRMEDFRILGPNTLGVCNFRWEPLGPDGTPRFNLVENDQLNRELQEVVERDGDAWFSYTVLDGRVSLRVNVENRCMEQSDIERLVQVICHTADKILAAK
ncbi:MAG: aminotransferase class I/II-fold pyridoxal phosphate-dependent enzyme [Gemmatimonadales bacterium]|nr:aminotransferase class I/II-fold pyridoxal phosphate-dependent enzyme [Gemmatimonadales bacterium]